MRRGDEKESEKRQQAARGRECSIDQSAISNAELLIGYRFIADGKSGTACYRGSYESGDLITLNADA